MSLGIKQIGGIIGVAAMTAGGLAVGCGANGPGGGLLDDLAKQCGLECSDKGIADGNFAISGYAPIDGFFKSVVNFKTVAAGVSGDIQAELNGIQLDFGLSDADVQAKGSLGAAIKAKLDADFKAKLKVDAQPAKCEVDASVTAQASVECKANANCDVMVDPGHASVECSGSCTADIEASAAADCKGDVECTVTGPSLQCSGTCEGSCTAKLDANAVCNGKCDGTCSVALDSGGNCAGTCNGNCTFQADASAQCSGTCNGSCTAKAPDAKCSGKLQCHVEGSASAKVQCNGKCDADFDPPKASGSCNAEASCDASAKADAKFSAKCTPPSVNITFDVDPSVQGDLKAQFDFAINDLKVRLPRLLAAVEKANLVLKAAEQLTTDGKTAIDGTISGFTKGTVGYGAAIKIANCVPDQLSASADAVTSSSSDLTAQVGAAGSLTSTFGM